MEVLNTHLFNHIAFLSPVGPFITKVFIIAPPSQERFLLKVEDYVPGFSKEKVKEEDSDSDDEEE